MIEALNIPGKPNGSAGIENSCKEFESKMH